jgi:hypothetical protein
MKYLIFLFIFLGACSTHKFVTSGAPRTQIFPPGVYNHEVTLTLEPGVSEKEKKYNFSGVIRVNSNEVKVVVLSSFGFTELQIDENIRNKTLKIDVVRESLKKFEPQIRSYYQILRLMLFEPLKGHSSPTHLEETLDGHTAIFDFSSFDGNNIPCRVDVSYPHFKIRIGVTSYEI